ncbi:hypothetical protein JKP88DRAFT_260798 [Tribonema minus]|uniref:Uncharacterized protein n=1 Tax=Tribonema minus TaxID=303371 RepID=A0A835ZHC7_9STRA|nr:hypothetical protein JKP88DRAFT_260798 [Tribonema minus]
MDHASKQQKVNDLLDAVSTRLDPEDVELLSSETVRSNMAARDLYYLKAIQRLTLDQLLNAGFTAGVAGALKTVFRNEVMDFASKRRKVNDLLDAASARLYLDDVELLSSETVRSDLAARDLYYFKAIQRLTFDQLIITGFTPGVAGARKTACRNEATPAVQSAFRQHHGVPIPGV